MKKLLSLVLCLASFVAHASQEWITTSEDGNLIYEVMHETAEITVQGDEWYAFVNAFEGGKFVSRYRVNVNGCPSLAGKMVIIAPSGRKSPVHNWVIGGDRIFDGIAFNVCVAAYMKKLYSVPGDSILPKKNRQM
jgi:hypothetical protein